MFGVVDGVAAQGVHKVVAHLARIVVGVAHVLVAGGRIALAARPAPRAARARGRCCKRAAWVRQTPAAARVMKRAATSAPPAESPSRGGLRADDC